MKLYEFECPANFVRDCEKLFSKKSYPEYIEKEIYKVSPIIQRRLTVFGKGSSYILAKI